MYVTPRQKPPSNLLEGQSFPVGSALNHPKYRQPRKHQTQERSPEMDTIDPQNKKHPNFCETDPHTLADRYQTNSDSRHIQPRMISHWTSASR